MKIGAVGVVSSDMERSVQFYKLLGFNFEGVKLDEDHVEPVVKDGDTRLMIDSVTFIEESIGSKPIPANVSSFAIEYESAEVLTSVADVLKSAGFDVVKEPWDAFWGQRYGVVRDPDGFMVDLYAYL